MPAGPWVTVVGMHRSGTSAIAGAIGALGLNVPRPQDRIDSPESNPEHWESESIVAYNDSLLEQLGGAWDAPPDLPEGWEHSPELDSLADPTDVVSRAYPHPGPVMWKDPRLCLLLPYWRLHLPSPITAVFVWRSPFAVARSLQERDGLQLLEGLALWERYNRSALEALVGSDVYVIDYEELVADPKRSLESLTRWLTSLDRFSDHVASWDVDRAVAVIATDLRHQPPKGDDRVLLSDHQQLIDQLLALPGGHQPLEVVPDIVESDWTSAMLEARRQLNSRQRELKEQQSERNQEVRAFQIELARVNTDLARVSTELARVNTEFKTELARVEADRADILERLATTNGRLTAMRASTSWRVTKPLRSTASFLHRASRRRQDPANRESA